MIRHPGPLYNWRSRKDVFDAIDDYIGTHGQAVKYASIRFKVGITTIYEWIKDGSIVHKKNSTRDGTNNRIISKYHLDWILYYLRNIDCQLYYPEMSDLLWVQFAEIYDKNLIRHALYMTGWTNKIVTGIAAEQNNVTRTLWRRWVEKAFPADYWMWGDETHVKRADARRKYGYAIRGDPAFVVMYNLRGQADGFSSIATMSIRGIETVTSYNTSTVGTIDGDKFLHTLEYVIFPSMNRYPGPRSVLGLDNAKVHMKDEIYAIAANFGVLVYFLPTYSYDFNPIELLFHLSKAYLKKYYNRNADAIDGSLINNFENSLYNCCDKSIAKNLFRKCYIYVDDDL